MMTSYTSISLPCFSFSATFTSSLPCGHLPFGIHGPAFGPRKTSFDLQLLHFTFQASAPPLSFLPPGRRHPGGRGHCFIRVTEGEEEQKGRTVFGPGKTTFGPDSPIPCNILARSRSISYVPNLGLRPKSSDASFGFCPSNSINSWKICFWTSSGATFCSLIYRSIALLLRTGDWDLVGSLSAEDLEHFLCFSPLACLTMLSMLTLDSLGERT